MPVTKIQDNQLNTDLTSKQNTLISGTNIKTINGEPLLGSGDIVISGGGGGSGLTQPQTMARISIGF